MVTELHVGIDDTDSEKGGCTTYTATVLFHELSSRGLKPSDFPWLVRLNPNIPWKTRGSSAVESGFRCVDHVDAKLVLRDNLALMDQELINRILFGGLHLLNA